MISLDAQLVLQDAQHAQLQDLTAVNLAMEILPNIHQLPLVLMELAPTIIIKPEIRVHSAILLVFVVLVQT